MPDRIRFYLDEMISNHVATGLRRRGIDAMTTGQAGNLALSDQEQLAFANTENRVFFTMDDDYLVLHASGHKHGGIVYVPSASGCGRQQPDPHLRGAHPRTVARPHRVSLTAPSLTSLFSSPLVIGEPDPRAHPRHQ